MTKTIKSGMTKTIGSGMTEIKFPDRVGNDKVMQK